MAEAPASVLDRHHFALRRLHSLTGIIPVGVFLINHLLTNATAWLSAHHFNSHVAWIHAMPFLLAIEIVGVFIPFAFHAIYGIVIAVQARPNAAQYGYADNWRYTLQRVTAWLTIPFLLIHLAHFRFAHWFGEMEYTHAVTMEGGFFVFTADAFLNWMPLWAWLTVYVIGLTAAVFHFCNGIVTFSITWGLVIGDDSRKRLSVAAGALALVLMTWGILSLYAMAQVDAAAPHEAAETVALLSVGG